MKTLILIPIFFILTISLVSAGQGHWGEKWCGAPGPVNGYDNSYECVAEWIVGDASAYGHARIDITDVRGVIKGGYVVGASYIGYSRTSGDILYYTLNSPSWESLWNSASCGSSGCLGEVLPQFGIIQLTSQPGDTYTDCIAFYAWDYDLNECCGSNPDTAWVTVTAGVGAIGSGNCLDLKSVECYDNDDCPGICDKNGEWTDWRCIDAECSVGDVKCVENTYYTCADKVWESQGIIHGMCGVECLVDTDCPPTETFGKCIGDSIATETVESYCGIDYICAFGATDEILGQCEFGCVMEGFTPVCVEGEEEEVCCAIVGDTDFQWTTESFCQANGAIVPDSNCEDDDTNGDIVCVVDDDCGTPTECVNGSLFRNYECVDGKCYSFFLAPPEGCLRECEVDDDCLSGYECIDYYCVKETPSPHDIGINWIYVLIGSVIVLMIIIFYKRKA